MVTEAIPEIAALGHEIPNIAEAGAGYYCRQEGKGLLLGAYESHCVHWAEDGTPPSSGSRAGPGAGRNAKQPWGIPTIRKTASFKRPMLATRDRGDLAGRLRADKF